VLANELLDNLAFDLLEWGGGGWHEVRVGLDDGEGLIEVLAPRSAEIDDAMADALPGLAASHDGVRVPLQRQSAAWLRDALRVAAPGRVVVIDYADTTAHFAQRPWHEWLRTYRGHDRGDAPLVEPGRQDVTCEVAIDQLARVRTPVADRSQAEFLRAHGLDELVDEGRRVWHERAHLGDLAAMRARSRVREAESLVAPDGLGAFRVLEWATGQGN
jgi:SAM-dependent MidA family methyltransferase